jgi:hypothetical protein
MAQDIWPAVIAVGGTLLGVGLGSYGTWRVEEIRWKRSREDQLIVQRKETYLHFLGANDNYFWQLQKAADTAQREKQGSGTDPKEGGPSFEDMLGHIDDFFDGVTSVRLFGSKQIQDVVEELSNAGQVGADLVSRGQPPKSPEWHAFEERWRVARNRFIDTTRKEMKIGD